MIHDIAIYVKNMAVVTVYMDLETTGLSVSRDRIIQIGAVAIRSTKPVYSEFQATVFTDHPIHPRASAVTGLYQKDLIDGLSIQLALTQFWAWVKLQVKEENDQLYCLAYNGIAFDFQLLFFELSRHQLEFLVPKNATFLDPYQWLKGRRSSLGVKSLRLTAVHLHLTGAPILQAHTALADARALSVVCEKDWFTCMLTSTGSHVWIKPQSIGDFQSGENTPNVDTQIQASRNTSTGDTPIACEDTPSCVAVDTPLIYDIEVHATDFAQSKRRKIKHDPHRQKDV